MAVLFGEATSTRLYSDPQPMQDSIAREQTWLGSTDMSPSAGSCMPTDAGADLKIDASVGLTTEPAIETGKGIDSVDDAWKDMINYPDDPDNDVLIIR